MKTICIIPARGGSKRIPRKNIKDFLGKPIIAYSIEAALNSRLFDEVMVSTDDEEIAAIAKQYGASVPFMRSDATANDVASTNDVLREVLREYQRQGKEFDVLCCLYATAPFVTVENIRKAYEKLGESYDSAFTVVRYSYPIQRALRITDGCIGLRESQYADVRSQDLEPMYHDAGQFYFSKVKDIDTFELWTKHTYGLELSELIVQDLDTETDWILAEIKYGLMHK
jgi:N-acylneuraminate cytidylyltransferase